MYILGNIGSSTGYFITSTMGVVLNVSPVTGIAFSGAKTGARIGKTFMSFAKGGWHNPAFYANGLSAGLSGTSFTIQCIAYAALVACPAAALPLYGASQCCSGLADTLDNSVGVVSTLVF